MIYFIKVGKKGPIKIGYTNTNPKHRIEAMKTGSPYPLKIIGVLDGGKNREKFLHEQFKDLRMNGEWFQPGIILKDFIKLNCRKELDNDQIKSQFRSKWLKDKMNAIEKNYILKVLRKTYGNKSQAANLLGLSRPTLHSKLILHKID